MNVEMPAPAPPRAAGAGVGAGVGAGTAKGGSDALDLVALALTAFLVSCLLMLFTLNCFLFDRSGIHRMWAEPLLSESGLEHIAGWVSPDFAGAAFTHEAVRALSAKI